jgi:hypothetical protein
MTGHSDDAAPPGNARGMVPAVSARAATVHPSPRRIRMIRMDRGRPRRPPRRVRQHTVAAADDGHQHASGGGQDDGAEAGGAANDGTGRAGGVTTLPSAVGAPVTAAAAEAAADPTEGAACGPASEQLQSSTSSQQPAKRQRRRPWRGEYIQDPKARRLSLTTHLKALERTMREVEQTTGARAVTPP